MDASWFIASRLKFRGKLTITSIAVSFFVMIVAISLASGFRVEIRKGITGLSGDVQLTPPNLNILDEGTPIEKDASYIPYIERLDYVSDIVPVAYRAGIVKEGENIHGVLFKGVPGRFADSLSFPISIPSRLSDITGLKRGDKLTAYFVGSKVKARKFTVVDLHESLVQTDDKLVVYADLSDVQRLNQWDSTAVSAIEIYLTDDYKNEQSIKEVSQEIGAIVNGYSSDNERPVIATSSVSRYPQLFDWLTLIDFNVVFILVLMIIVAGFNMISGLLIMLFENISAIGLLKSLGMTDRSIAKVFLSGAAVLVLKGMCIGNALALLFCFVQDRTHLMKLDPANYFVSFVPVHPDVAMIFLCDLSAFMIIMVFLLIPCIFISKVDPAQTVRYS